MKKLLIALFLCAAILPVYTQDGRFRMPDRSFELGFAHVSAGFSNNFLSVGEFFQETAVIDIDDLSKGLTLNLDFAVTPFYFSFNKNNRWGFGLSSGINAEGVVSLSGNMLAFNEAESDKSDVGFALFADVQLSTFFHIANFKIKASPSVYYPIVYVDSDVSYSFNASNSELDLYYDMRVYTAWSMELAENEGTTNLDARPGVDITLGIEYPLMKMLGLAERFKILDFTLGADFINIPIVPSQMRHYMGLWGQVSGSLDIFDEDSDFDNFFSSSDDDDDTMYGTANKNILRPFTLHTWADWHPFRKIPISFLTTLGFQINPLYEKPFSMEAGVRSRIDLKNILIVDLGVGYHDRLWKNSIDLALNLRFFELNLGFDLRSADFLKSWQGAGFGVDFGIRFGW